MRKITTGCCALCQIDQVNNFTTVQELKETLNTLKVQKENNKEVGISTGNGQTAVFVIVCPGEDILESNLKRLGFVYKHTFERRKGYNELTEPRYRGDLKMYIKNL